MPANSIGTATGGQGSLGQVDGRSPAAFQKTIPAAVNVLLTYFSALAARDLDGMSTAMHYPFATFEGTDVQQIADQAALHASPPPSMDIRPESAQVKADSYDILDGFAVHVYGPVGAGCSLSYSRYDARGARILVSDGIYGITNNDGRWGIELISTIVTPDRAVGVRYRDAEEAALRHGRDWMLGYSRRDQSILNSTQQFGTRAHLGLANPRENARNAREGRPLDGYPVEGVKSRLRVSSMDAQSLAALDANFEQFAGWAGGGVGQWDYTISLPQARVLHAGPDKTHTLGGYLRYTADSTLISETRSLGISTYRAGRWGNTGGIGVMMYHDRSNDRQD